MPTDIQFYTGTVYYENKEAGLQFSPSLLRTHRIQGFQVHLSVLSHLVCPTNSRYPGYNS